MPEPISLDERRRRAEQSALAKLSREDRTRYETLHVAATLARQEAHRQLDQQLDLIMPELLAAIDAGRTFTVLVIDPEALPVIPDPAPKIVVVDG